MAMSIQILAYFLDAETEAVATLQQTLRFPAVLEASSGLAAAVLPCGEPGRASGPAPAPSSEEA